MLLPIASGGMGTVYLARATSIGGFEREVALKVMHAHLKGNSDFASELVEEAKLTVSIRHPNVVAVIDVGDGPCGVFLVMDYVEGDTLGGLQARAASSPQKRLPPRIGLRILVDALAGLHAAHELEDASGRPTNLVHRDFSPQNILVGVDGIGRLSDFGIAKAATRISDTSTGVIKGKIAYMSPEQTRGAPLDRRADVWAAGVVAWQIIAGRRLYGNEENDISLLLRIASTPPPRLRDVVPGVPAQLDEVVAKAVAMDRDERWPTAHAFKQALQVACRACNETAATDDVAALVTQLTRPVLEQRRARARGIVEAREAIAHDDVPTVVTPSVLTFDDEPTQARSSSTPRRNVHALTRTDTTSIAEPRVAERGRSLGAVALAGSIVMFGVVVTAVTWAVASRRDAALVSAPIAPSTLERSPGGERLVATVPETVTPPSVPANTTRAKSARAPTRQPSAAHATSTSLLPQSPYERFR